MSLSNRLNDAVFTQKLGAQTVLMHIQSGEYFELNPSGSLTLERLLAGASVDQVALLLSQHYAVSQAQAHTDVEALLAQLRNRALIQQV